MREFERRNVGAANRASASGGGWRFDRALCARGRREELILVYPDLGARETLGLLHLQATDDVPQLESAELSFKTTFAGQVGLSIANIRLREALRMQSVRDALTGLYNRRYLEEVLDREIRRADVPGNPWEF